MDYACNNLKVKFSQLTYNRHASFPTVITTFVCDGPSNLSQESTTCVNTITMHQQDMLYPLLYDLSCHVCSNSIHWIQTYLSGVKCYFYHGNVLGNLSLAQSNLMPHHLFI